MVRPVYRNCWRGTERSRERLLGPFFTSWRSAQRFFVVVLVYVTEIHTIPWFKGVLTKFTLLVFVGLLIAVRLEPQI